MNLKDNEWNTDNSHTVRRFFPLAISLTVQALLSHHSEAHSSCGAPVRQVQMLQLLLSRLVKRPLSFRFLSFPLFRTLRLFWENSRLLRSCTFSSSPSPPLPSPVPSLRAGGHGAVTHHLVIIGTKGALVATAAAAQCATPPGRESGGKSPRLDQFPSVLRRPHLLRWWKLCQCGLGKNGVCQWRE